MHNFLNDKSPSDFFYHIDNFQLSYLGVGLWANNVYEGSIIAGPFLSDIPDDLFILNVIEKNNLPLGSRLQLHEYYKSLTIFSSFEYKNIGYLLVNLCVNPFMPAKILFSKNDDFIISKREKNEFENEKFYSEVEMRYKLEKEIINAVENGSKEEALRLVDFFQFNVSHRVPNNPLRAHKNLIFVFNTLLRKAAESGGVSPVYIHNLSDRFAISIENIPSITELQNLQAKMISEYCDLVKRQSTAGYSPVVRKAINYINLNFDNALSLNVIAENIDVSPAHLSRQFKKETNFNITEFINKRRVEEAKFLIEQNNNSITEIALMVGFENHNYFCTVFKQITSLTPKEYLCKTRKK